VANTLVTPVGRINNTSATPLALGTAYDTKYATYLKLFSGEMFKAYESSTIAKGTVQSRTLKNGKAMQVHLHRPYDGILSRARNSYPG
jgi:hypothetical protein